MADIQAALAVPGLPESAQQALTKLYNYLDKHREHIQYDKLKQAGLPIGSGLVESTCKVVDSATIQGCRHALERRRLQPFASFAFVLG
ncbi:MAG: hypothetical protein IPM39_14860 [Chloroflexi bacterium]|nr:hypothetical protein [Chloroflexota bacterium]